MTAPVDIEILAQHIVTLDEELARQLVAVLTRHLRNASRARYARLLALRDAIQRRLP